MASAPPALSGASDRERDLIEFVRLCADAEWEVAIIPLAAQALLAKLGIPRTPLASGDGKDGSG